MENWVNYDQLYELWKKLFDEDPTLSEDSGLLDIINVILKELDNAKNKSPERFAQITDQLKYISANIQNIDTSSQTDSSIEEFRDMIASLLSAQRQNEIIPTEIVPKVYLSKGVLYALNGLFKTSLSLINE